MRRFHSPPFNSPSLIELERGNNSKKLSASPISFSKERRWSELKSTEGYKTQQHKAKPCKKYLTDLKKENKCKMKYSHCPSLFQKRGDGGELKSPV